MKKRRKKNKTKERGIALVMVMGDWTTQFMVDTGASVVALTPDDAARLGLKLTPEDFSGSIITASGPARAAPARTHRAPARSKPPHATSKRSVPMALTASVAAAKSLQAPASTAFRSRPNCSATHPVACRAACSG